MVDLLTSNSYVQNQVGLGFFKRRYYKSYLYPQLHAIFAFEKQMFNSVISAKYQQYCSEMSDVTKRRANIAI